MGQAAEVYAEQLSSLSLGYPLWFPESSESAGEPQIGDVGYVSNGRFWRLFNVTVPHDHPWNAFGGPEDYTPFIIPERQHHREDKYLSPNLLHSRSLHAARMSSQVAIAGSPLAQANISYQFECSNEHGAFLALNNKAERQSIDRSLMFERYIARNHRSWHYFVTQQGVRCEPGELVCISGWVKTSEWMVAAFLKNERSHACSIQGQMGPFANAGCEVTIIKSNSMSAIYHSGPQTFAESNSSPWTAGAQVNDQTIFIEFYKVRYRLRIPKVLKAAMGPSTLPPSDENPDSSSPTLASDSDSDGSVELDTVSPAETSAKTSLDHVLDRLLELAPHADLAITSHGHLNDLLASMSATALDTSLQRLDGAPVEVRQDFLQDLRRSPPQVHLQTVDDLDLVLLVDPAETSLAPPDAKSRSEQTSGHSNAVMFSALEDSPSSASRFRSYPPILPGLGNTLRYMETVPTMDREPFIQHARASTETEMHISYERGAFWPRKRTSWLDRMQDEVRTSRLLESERPSTPELDARQTPSTWGASSGLPTPAHSLPLGASPSSMHVRSPLASALASEEKEAEGSGSMTSRFRNVFLSSPINEDDSDADDDD